jgi:UDP-N-acetylglucosamine--N-acetylmuramyl-(pentapeptide) pyrophosphoryl-undecaprenol N-acetylglucosamine transferase
MADETLRSRRSGPVRGHALLAGGGSGGHVFPALAIGDELKRRGWRLSFAGSPTGMEARLVEGRGLAFVSLAARPWVGRSPWQKVRAMATLLGSTFTARRALRKRGVDLVIGTGGYASAPAVLGAALARRPSLLVEPNARAGSANRLLSRFARAAALAYDSTAADLACPTFVSGVPVRETFFDVPDLPTPPPRHLLVLGGSQGSRRLNELVPRAVAAATALPDLTVLHQCGARHVDAARRLWDASGAGERAEVVPFVADVPAELARASVVVSRAGAITLAELCAAGRASILVPLPLAGAHQEANARRLEELGAALVLTEEQGSPTALAARLADLFATTNQLVALARAARALARRGAASAIADSAEGLLAGRRR